MIRFCIVLGIAFLFAQITHGFRPLNRFSSNHASKYQLQAAKGMDIGRPALKQLAGVLLGAGLFSSPMQSIAATKSAAPSATSSAATTTKPSEKIKLAEEIAYDGAIERKNANKARQQALKTEIKDSKSKISLLGNEIKRLDSQLLGIERKLGTRYSRCLLINPLLRCMWIPQPAADAGVTIFQCCHRGQNRKYRHTQAGPGRGD